MSKRAENGKKGSVKRLLTWFHGASAKCAAMILLGSVLLFGLFALACATDRYSLQAGDIAHQTITATKDVEDTVTTEQHRKAAAAAVEASYHLKEGASEEVMMSLEDLFAELSMVQQYGQNLRNAEENPLVSVNRSYSGEEIAYAQSLVKGISLTPYQTRVLLNTQTESFNTMVSEVRTAVANALNTTIREGQVTTSISNINAICKYRVDSDLTNSIVPVVLNAVIKPNMVVDEVATEAARQAARDGVEPVIYKQGQNIVREGERVSAYQIAMLSSLGLLDNTRIDLTVYGGAALIVLVTVLLMVLMLHMLNPDALSDPRQIMVIMLVMLISVGLGVISVKLINVHLIPVALGAMLLTGLLGARTGLTAGIALSVILSSLSAGSNGAYSEEMVPLLMTGIIGSVVAVKFLAGKPQRVRTVICGVLVAGVNLVLMLAQGLMTAANLQNTMSNAVWSMAGGVVSGLIAVGFQPVFEAAFNLATPSKLLELANPNQPLLRRLLLEAPGTYHHAIIVANLSEAAAERIGANPLLARTGAYFHDIGKLKRPLYFKENQRGDNPHDRTDPYVSAAIVTAHTSDGLALAQKYHLPPEIQRIIVEHHGDTPVMYFYHKALQQADGKPVDIKDFRYGGTRPSTKESAIVMLADTIEAAVRSMPDPTPQAIQRFIERLVRGKIEDGQLSNSPLSLLDIDGICEAFSAVLSGVFHERIEYPTVQMSPDGKAIPVAKTAATKPIPQTTAPMPVAQNTDPTPVVQSTAPTPVVAPVPQITAPTTVVKPETQPVAPVSPAAEDASQAPTDTPVPEDETVDQPTVAEGAAPDGKEEGQA
ncbi:MAG: HDIG domain-containing protein [Clostridiales bacterium]|nr:HDIG domain-containing protein [Clostridiales bacterium]